MSGKVFYRERRKVAEGELYANSFDNLYGIVY